MSITVSEALVLSVYLKGNKIFLSFAGFSFSFKILYLNIISNMEQLLRLIITFLFKCFKMNSVFFSRESDYNHQCPSVRNLNPLKLKASLTFVTISN